MTTGLRRNTFTLSRSDLPKMAKVSVYKLSGMDRQNIMRLKVNRIAIIQELRVEHILEQLCTINVLSEKETTAIEKGTSASDRARRLIDILITKDKTTNWYKHFRFALQNPDAEVEFQRRYHDIVEFLDNTVIHRPNSQAAKFSTIDNKMTSLQYPKYEPLPAIVDKGTQNVLYLNEGNSSLTVDSGETDKLDNDRDVSELDIEKYGSGTEKSTLYSYDKTWSDDSHDMMHVKGYFHQSLPVPNNFNSVIAMSIDHIRSEGNQNSDKTIIINEHKAFQKIQRLEIVHALVRQKQLPLGFEISMCSALQDMLIEPECYHLYLKFFRTMKINGVNLIHDITNSYKAVLKSLEVFKQSQQAIHIGFQIVDMFVAFYEYVEAGEIIGHLIQFLNTEPCLETCTTMYKAYVKLTDIRNKEYDYSGSQRAYFSSVEMTWPIKMKSEVTIDESASFVALSTMLMETGSYMPALAWASRALHDVSAESSDLVITALCNGVMAYCGMWQAAKAEALAVQAIQMANKMYGDHHPVYLKSLLLWCHVCSEFFHTDTGVVIAKECLKLAGEIYGCETITTAAAHRAVSRALIVTQDFTDDAFYHHAMEAIRIARAQLPPSHPMLHIFLYTFATALQWKSLNCPADVEESTLRWAEAETRQALIIVSASYGEISVQTGQMFVLLGQIYSKMSRFKDAEKNLVRGVNVLKLCQSPASNVVLLASATLATYYKIMTQITDAFLLLRQVVQHIESTGVYHSWINMCYNNLIELLEESGQDLEAESVKKDLASWLENNPRQESRTTLETLSENPTDFRTFLAEFDKSDNIRTVLEGGLSHPPPAKTF